MTSQDPRDILDQLGATWSPDFDAFCAGERDPAKLRCVLCGKAPCECVNCPATKENRYYRATGRPQFELCGMRVDPQTGECPRGHRAGDAR